eukprot:3653217-Amphidinium_carterae.1
MPMDLGYLPWSNKGKGKDGKGHKVHKGDKALGKGGKDGWWNGGKEEAATRERKAKATVRVAETPNTLPAIAASVACGVTNKGTTGYR